MNDLNLSERRVLVIDDQPFVRRSLVHILANLGAEEIAEAGDGDEALEILAAAAPAIDTVFCDLQMPGRDGIEVIRDLARLELDVGIVLISGEDQELLSAAANLAAEHGLRVLGNLPKPVTAEQVSALLQPMARGPRRGGGGPAVAVDAGDLRMAIEGGEIVPYYQPKIRMATRSLESVEALARWLHPEHGIISPGVFIPLAEENALIDEVTAVMLEQAQRQCSQWAAEDLSVQLAVNLSVDSLERLDLPEYLVGVTGEAGVPPSQVVLEVTESRLSDNPTALLDITTRLRLKRFELSIDDFGTGYSSLKQLQRLPFTDLKVDQAFVTGAAEDEKARSILESSVDLARRLGMKIVVEGVESQADWDLVADLGCDLAQGYFIARPMPGEEVKGWLEQWRQRQT